MKATAPAYLALCEGPADDKAVERALDAFAEKDKREAFFKFVRELQGLYEIISPDVFLREHLDNYAKLSTLYEIVQNAFTKKTALYRDIAKKTESLVRERVATFGMTTTLPLVKIDEHALDALRRKGGSANGKILNLGKSLIQAAQAAADQQPYLLPIGERAEAILDSYDDRQIGTQAALKALENLLAEYVEAKKAQEQAGFDLNTFTLFWVLKQAGAPEPERVAPVLDQAFQRFPNHAHNAKELRDLKAEIYKILLPAVGKEHMVELAERLLRLKRP
jgi:type I restriction enzyme R subunit